VRAPSRLIVLPKLRARWRKSGQNIRKRGKDARCCPCFAAPVLLSSWPPRCAKKRRRFNEPHPASPLLKPAAQLADGWRRREPLTLQSRRRFSRARSSFLKAGRITVITIEVNGASRQINIEPDTPLLWVLRDVVGLTGTKFGCGIAQCGACTVHVNGTAMRSCSVPIGSLDGAKIVTIEGLSPDNNHPVQRAWIEEGVPQCGYCQSGQIMAVVTFLKKYSKPTDADIDANITNICRCGTYEPLRRAIHRAADMMKT
jgi:isoquinoline 1-oxidoreductase alpha subunit